MNIAFLSRHPYVRTLTHLFILLFLGRTTLPLAIAAEPDSSQTLVDLSKQDAVKQIAGGATLQYFDTKLGPALEVSTNKGEHYPGVQFEPRAGKWDLTKFDAVAADIINTDNKPLRVLLTINNPGADGRNNCNSESAEIGANSRGTVLVPFGSWHGSLDHPIDQANIVSVRVFLDRPGEAKRFLVLNVRAVKLDDSQITDLLATPFISQLSPPFQRGVNLGNALDAPAEGEWGVTLKEEYFEKIAQAGFDTIRLPVRWSAHARLDAPYTIDENFFQRVDWAIDQALSRKLKLILNVHHYEELINQPGEHRARFLALWEQIARRYAARSADLSFELLNEPHQPLSADAWNELLAESLAVVRKTNPARTVVVGPVSWNAISALPTLKLPADDRNLVATFHFYDPFLFTHQGASWATEEAKQAKGRKWTATKAEQMAIRRSLNAALAWSVEHKTPIFMGEFGAYEQADMESRARWTQFVGDAAAKRKMGYVYWEFCSGFAVYDQRRGEWIEPLKAALLAPRFPPSAKP